MHYIGLMIAIGTTAKYLNKKLKKRQEKINWLKINMNELFTTTSSNLRHDVTEFESTNTSNAQLDILDNAEQINKSYNKEVWGSNFNTEFIYNR